ncbi:hypothetical protein [Microbacterium sp. gxy059]|uniref:hypothetical protein n=1 Tax=Microbacterium sp. gxy059 TaxID=2957199 RepID=UPI003D9575D4
MSTSLTGEITTVLGALGQDAFDPGGLELLTLAGATYDDESYPGEVYRTFPHTGITVVYEKKRAAMSAQAVFLYIAPQDGASAYLTPDQLIDGLPLTTATRDDIRGFLGDAVCSEELFDIFAVEGGYLHIEFDADGALRQVTAMQEVPGL